MYSQTALTLLSTTFESVPLQYGSAVWRSRHRTCGGEMKAVTARNTPLDRLATAEDLCGVVDFLTSEQSRWITGTVVLAYGGLSLGHSMMSAPRPGAEPAVAGDYPGTVGGDPATPEPHPTAAANDSDTGSEAWRRACGRSVTRRARQTWPSSKCACYET
jgi:hypothetical protein